MKTIDIYSGTINDKEMSLSVTQYHSEITECEMFYEKEFVLIGISLGNSYFNEERLEVIFKAFSSNFKRVAVLLVDKLSSHNYRAMGYSEKKIEKKVRTNSNLTVNRITRAIERTNIIYKKDNIEFYMWDDIENFNAYPESLQMITDLYKTNTEFKSTIIEIIQNLLKKDIDDASRNVFLDEAKWYFLKELAMGCCLNEFFNEKNILVCYYQDFKFYREFFEKNYIEMEESHKQDYLTYYCSE